MNAKLFALCALTALFSACNCNPQTCVAGEKDCPCKEANTCNDGLACASNVCVAPTTGNVQVSDANARACELVLTETTGTSVASVTFNGGVVGTYIREAPRTAVTFAAPNDAVLPTSAIEVALSGPTSGVTVSRVSCVDSAGQKLANAAITIR